MISYGCVATKFGSELLIRFTCPFVTVARHQPATQKFCGPAISRGQMLLPFLIKLQLQFSFHAYPISGNGVVKIELLAFIDRALEIRDINTDKIADLLQDRDRVRHEIFIANEQRLLRSEAAPQPV